MKINHLKHFGLACMLGMLTASCGDDYLNAYDKSVITTEDEADMEKENPEQLLTIINSRLTGIYAYLAQPTFGALASDFGWMSLCHLSDIMTEDIAMHKIGSGQYTFDYALDYWKQDYVRGHQIWLFFYTIINRSNEVLEKINPETTNSRLREIMGELHALRGYSYFYLAQFFQRTYVGHENEPGCPIYYPSSVGGDILNRASLSRVYAQIDADFLKALELLTGVKHTSKTSIDESVASGLYARVCLVKNDWANAVKYAQLAQQTSNTTLMTISSYEKDGFNNLQNEEWMWGIDINAKTATGFASFFSFVGSYDAGYGGDVGAYRKIDARLYGQFSQSDVRRKNFKDPKGNYSGKEALFPDYTNLKFKKVANWEGDYVFMRRSEMLLIEAEAYARQNELSKAAETLGKLMVNRDPSWQKMQVSVDEVYLQRRLELWGEGFALFDRQRLKKGIERLYSGSNHLVTQQFNVVPESWYFHFQISRRELENNNYISAADQNPAPNESDKVYK